MSTPAKKPKATLKRDPPQPQETATAAAATTTKDLVDETEGDIIVVSTQGDVVLAVEHETHTEGVSYRVESSRLKESSAYFKRLLDPEFEEGTAVARRHAEIKTKYTAVDTVPAAELPRVNISHVGRISPAVKSIKQLMSDFLRALHGRDLGTAVPPLANVANLVIVADRFDCLAALRQYCKSRKLIAALDGKTSDKSAKTWSEERVRQRLLVGMFLENPSWVYQSSLRLIHRGWVGREPEEDSALWWDLPMGIEDELLFRRDCALDAVQSLQSHFLNVYTSRERQCKLGYDSSAECDLYQLGQMVKFFKRIGTLSLQGSIFADAEPPEPYAGDILDLVDSYKTVPEYQVDKNHHHCGLRTRLLPLLEVVTFSLGDVGVCWWCWQECRHEYAWSKVKRPLMWKKDSAGAGMYQQYKNRQAQSHLFKHLDTRDLFMANERLWTG